MPKDITKQHGKQQRPIACHGLPLKVQQNLHSLSQSNYSLG